MGSGKWGQGANLDKMPVKNIRFPSITGKSLHFGRQLGLRLSPIVTQKAWLLKQAS